MSLKEWMEEMIKRKLIIIKIIKNHLNLSKEYLNVINIAMIDGNNNPNTIFLELFDGIIEKITKDLFEQILSNILTLEIEGKKKLISKNNRIHISLNNNSISLKINQIAYILIVYPTSLSSRIFSFPKYSF